LFLVRIGACCENYRDAAADINADLAAPIVKGCPRIGVLIFESGRLGVALWSNAA
jgi:hypothetical protein